MRSFLPRLLLQFSVVYGVLVWICIMVPAYAWVERGTAAVVDLTLAATEAPGVTRSLGFQQQDEQSAYMFDVEIDGVRRTLRRPYHKHGFVLVLFLGLALGTPGLGLRRRLVALGVGGLLSFGLCVGMLMTDVQMWERDAFHAPGPASDGAYPGIVMSMRGLHQTAAAGMLPVIIWALLVAGPMLTLYERPRATSPA